MSNILDVVRANIVVVGLPETFCFETFRDLLLALPQFLSVEVPNSVTNVIVSPSQPLDSQTTSVWCRTNNAGGFEGIYVFANGEWVPIYPAPGQIFWLAGDSDNPPDGFTLVDLSNAQAVALLTAPVVTTLTGLYLPAGPGPWTYYAATWSGL